MRADMAKVIVERPRTGGHGKVKQQRVRDLEALPQKESGRRSHRYNRKNLNENLAPLYRWLNAQVGRNWDKVNSELRERIDVRSAVQAHIWQHVKDYVVSKGVFYEGKVPYYTNGYKYTKLAIAAGDLYVCPKTNLLKKNGVRKRARHVEPTPDPAVFRRVKSHIAYMKIDDVWYQLTLAPLPEEIVETRYENSPYLPYVTKHAVLVKDVHLNGMVGLNYSDYGRNGGRFSNSPDTRKAYGDGRVYCTHKKQLNSETIRKAGLK